MKGRAPLRLWADQWDFFSADTITVIEDEQPSFSPLLGPDAQPLPKPRTPMGFDLSPRRDTDA